MEEEGERGRKWKRQRIAVEEPHVEKVCFASSQYCTSKNCIRDLIARQKIGEGAFGTVYDACLGQDDCRYVVKIQPVNPSSRFDEFKREATIAEAAYSLGAGPRVIRYTVCENFGTHPEQVTHLGLIIMDKWPATLRTFLVDYGTELDDQRKRQLLSDVEAKLRILLRNGIWHRDLKDSNVLVQHLFNIPTAVAITDFGQSVRLTSPFTRELAAAFAKRATNDSVEYLNELAGTLELERRFPLIPMTMKENLDISGLLLTQTEKVSRYAAATRV